LIFSAAAALALVAGCIAALFLPGLQVSLVAAGFAGYVVFGRLAMVLMHVDEEVFTRRSTARPSRAGSAVAAGLMLGTIASFALAQGSRPEASARRPGAPGAPRTEDAQGDTSSTPLPFPRTADSGTSEKSE
jgi:hypothetical protein